MSRRGSPGMFQTKPARFSIAKETSAGLIPSVAADDRHRFFGVVWYVVNILLILAILLVAYSAAWEYSTRRYLKGFSDAIVPASSLDEEKSKPSCAGCPTVRHERRLVWRLFRPTVIRSTHSTTLLYCEFAAQPQTPTLILRIAQE